MHPWMGASGARTSNGERRRETLLARLGQGLRVEWEKRRTWLSDVRQGQSGPVSRGRDTRGPHGVEGANRQGWIKR